MTETIVTDVRPLLAGIRTGMAAADVGRWLGVSRERVRQIWVRETGAGVPKGRASRDRPSVRARLFWASVVIQQSGCWQWIGPVYPTGYGRPPFAQSRTRNDKRTNGYVHRVAYEWLVGPIPAGLTIDHLCNNRLCVNPAHLDAVTSRTNTLRSATAVAAINARKTHCVHGHPFDEANTLYSTGKSGVVNRRCLACRRRNSRNSRARLQRTAA